jgi:PAS domain S-box-containing protein
MSERSTVHVLLVEDNPGDARLVREALRDASWATSMPDFRLTAVERLSEGIEAIEQGDVEVILLDLALPDSRGFATFEKVHSHAPDLPIVVLTQQDDDSFDTRALREGAQDYLSKNDLDPTQLSRSIKYAQGRKEAERARVSVARAETARGAAEDSEARFRALAETMPQLVWRARPEGSIDYFNGRWYEYTGLAADPTAEESDGDGWARALHPSEMSLSEARWTQCLRSGDELELECRLRRRDGSYRWFLGRAVATRDAIGGVSSWFGTFTDIDDHKRAERSLRTLALAGATLAHSHDVAATLRNVARLVVPALADWSALHLSEPTGIRLVGTVHTDPGAEHLVYEARDVAPAPLDAPFGYARVIRSGQGELVSRLPAAAVADALGDAHRDVGAALGVLSLVIVPLAVSGRTIGALTLIACESERVYGPDDMMLAEEIGRRVAVALDSARTFELIRFERQRAEEANRAKDEFLSVASHELRTPLNAILGWSRLLRAGGLPDDKRERAVETIERNAKIQVQLVDDILDVSRIITGKLKLSVAPADVAQVVEAAVDVVKAAADAKGVRLEVACASELGSIQGDAGRLQQVVWNLVSNAVKFTPRNGTVRIGATRAVGSIEIVVADDGQGIEPHFLPHVFEAFRQADGSSTRSFGGLGLGLAIVRHLVELHGGRIEAHSDGPGRGSTFVLRIPVATGRRDKAPAPAESQAAPPESDRAGPESGVLAGLRILLIDDQPDAIELMSLVLEQGGATVLCAASAPEAFDVLRSERPAIVVSDVGLPGEDGYSLVRRIRALAPEDGGSTPVIALTAYTRREDRERALRAGFNEHVTKPVEPNELFGAIAAAMRGGSPSP